MDIINRYKIFRNELHIGTVSMLNRDMMVILHTLIILSKGKDHWRMHMEEPWIST